MSFDAFAPFEKGSVELPALFFVAADWCGHCHDAAPAVARAVTPLQKRGVKTYILKADRDGAAIDKLDVTAFPTFLVVARDRRITEYRGPRTTSGLVAFVRSTLKV